MHIQILGYKLMHEFISDNILFTTIFADSNDLHAIK